MAKISRNSDVVCKKKKVAVMREPHAQITAQFVVYKMY